jgi:hypothetical protein
VQGLSRILADARARRAAVLVMPHLDSWALCRVPGPGREEAEAGRLVASAAWKMFLQEMGGGPAAHPGLILVSGHSHAAARQSQGPRGHRAGQGREGEGGEHRES